MYDISEHEESGFDQMQMIPLSYQSGKKRLSHLLGQTLEIMLIQEEVK